MNYYNPYFGYPIANARTGLFSRLFKNINFSSILNGAQKTLNIVNQTIPLIKQARPIIKNAKTMFKVMNEFKKIDNTPHKKEVADKKTEPINYNDGPTFFA